MGAIQILTLLNTLTHFAVQEATNGDLDKVKSLLHVLHMVHGRIVPSEAAPAAPETAPCEVKLATRIDGDGEG